MNKSHLNKIRHLNIKSAQVTFDGNEYVHNKIRMHLNRLGSYKKIFNNIRNLTDEIDIFARVNVTINSLNSIRELLDDLQKIKNKIKQVIITPVMETLSMSQCSCAFLLEGHIESFLKLNSIIMEYGLEPIFPVQGTCLDYFDNIFSISSNGKLFTCPCLVSKDTFSIGSIHEGTFNTSYPSYILAERWDSCYDCEYLFLCSGGCRYRAIKESGKWGQA